MSQIIKTPMVRLTEYSETYLGKNYHIGTKDFRTIILDTDKDEITKIDIENLEKTGWNILKIKTERNQIVLYLDFVVKRD